MLKAMIIDKKLVADKADKAVNVLVPTGLEAVDIKEMKKLLQVDGAVGKYVIIKEHGTLTVSQETIKSVK